MDSFRGKDAIYLQPGDTNIPYHFQLTVATSSTLNNGLLPYNSTLHSFTMTAHQRSGTTVGTSDLVVGSSKDGNTMVARLGYSTSLNSCLHHIEFFVTASIAGATDSVLKREFDFNRLWVKDK